MYDEENTNKTYNLNKKLEETNEQLDEKNKLILSLKLQISSLQNYKLQTENLKKQNLFLEEKLNISEIENSSFFSEKLKEVILT